MPALTTHSNSAPDPTLHMALDLGDTTWCLARVAAGGILVGLIALSLSVPPDSGAGAFASAAEGLTIGQVALQVAYAALMFGVCLLACVVPTRRGVASRADAGAASGLGGTTVRLTTRKFCVRQHYRIPC